MTDRLGRREFLQASSTLLLSGAVARAGEASPGDNAGPPLQAGAAEVDISPSKFPVLASGGFLERTASELRDPLHARGLVLSDGKKKLAIIVVDTLMMPREMLDEVKREASARTGIPPESMIISATHTHSAPSVMGALGTGVDEAYAPFPPGKIVECIEKAAAVLEPARVGWASVVDEDDTHCRVWIRRPDRIGADPFGEPTIRAMMHPGYQNPDYLGPCGPEDPELSVLSVVRPDGSPLALVANYSMHYFRSAPVSAAHFAGGRMAARCPLGDSCTVEMWIHNCLPNDARAVTGYFFSRGPDGVQGAPREHLGIGGTFDGGSLVGRLIFFNGDTENDLVVGKTVLPVGVWQHVALVRQGARVAAYLNGAMEPELEGEIPSGCAAEETSLFVGGRSDNRFNFEGKLSQVAIFDRALAPGQVAGHFCSANSQGAS